MAVDTASDILAFKKQGTGNNLNTWGDELNHALDRISEAIADRTELSLTGNYTPLSTNYVANETRAAVLVFSDGGLSSTPTVTLPARKKLYWAKNTGSTYAVTLGVSGGTSVSIPTGGRWVHVFCDGTDCEIYDPEVGDLKPPTAAFDMNSQKITSLGTPTAATDAATKGYIDTLAASGDLATVAGIASEITTVADIEDGTVATNAVTDVAGIASNVTTVAGISGNVTTVAGISANVTTVAGISANVTTVAGDSADIQALGPISANITTVAGISSDVTAVAGDATDIGTVAANIAAVTNVSTNMTDVQNASSLVDGLTAADVGAIADPGTVTANNVPQWDGASGSALKNGLTVGISANNLVQLDGSSRLPAVDGSQLTNLPTPSIDYELISTASASASSSVEFNGIDTSTYKIFVLYFESVVPSATSASYLIQFRQSGGSYRTTGYSADCVRMTGTITSASFTTGVGLNNTTTSSTSDTISGHITVQGMGDAGNRTTATGICTFEPNGSKLNSLYSGNYDTAEAHDGIRLIMSTGNVTSGEFYLFGLRGA